MIDLKSLYENIVELQKRLEQATIDRAVLEEQVSAQTQTNKNRISELNSRKNKLTTQLKALQRQRSSSENIITIDRKLNPQIDNLEKQIAEIDSEKEKLSSTKPESSSDLEKINAQISSIFEEYNQLVKSTKTSIEEEKKSLEEQYKELSAVTPEVLEDLSQRLEQLDIKRTDLEHQSFDLLQERDELQEKLKDNKYIDYHEDFKSRINQINDMLKQLETEEAQIDDAILSSKQEVFPKLSSLNKKLSTLKAQKNEKEDSLKKQIAVQIADSDQRWNELLQEKNELEEKLNNPDYIDYHSQFNSRIKAIDSELEQLRQHSQQLQASYPQDLSSIDKNISQKESQIADLFLITPDEIAKKNSDSINSFESRIDQLNTFSKSLKELSPEKTVTTKAVNPKGKKSRKENNNSHKKTNIDLLLNSSFEQIIKAIENIDPSIQQNKEKAKRLKIKEDLIHSAMHQARKALKDKQEQEQEKEKGSQPPSETLQFNESDFIRNQDDGATIDFTKIADLPINPEIFATIEDDKTLITSEKSQAEKYPDANKAEVSDTDKAEVSDTKATKPDAVNATITPNDLVSPESKQRLSAAIKEIQNRKKPTFTPPSISPISNEQEASSGQSYEEQGPSETLKAFMDDFRKEHPYDDGNEEIFEALKHAEDTIDPGLSISTSEPKEETSLVEKKPSIIDSVIKRIKNITHQIRSFFSGDKNDGAPDFETDNPNTSNESQAPNHTSFVNDVSRNGELRKNTEPNPVVPTSQDPDRTTKPQEKDI